MKFLVGIDEVGRGPLAGPVGVGVVKVPQNFSWALIPGVGDSKALTPKHREEVFRRATKLRDDGLIDFRVELISATYIDTHGIMSALKKGMQKAIAHLELTPEECFFKLDGSLRAPQEFKQITIIRGDATEPSIGLASIMAKVTRDRYMERLHIKYPEYGFASHKGYGTPAHRDAIATVGLSPVHRVSYCQNILGE